MKRSELIPKAIDYATDMHHGQMRKGENLPYIVHPLRVMAIISPFTSDEHVLAAAALHDVVEDTEATFAEVSDLFGAKIGRLVYELTDKSRPEDGNRAARKAIDRDCLAASSKEAHLIKVADLIDNAPSIIKYQPKFAPVYIQEEIELLKVLGGAPAALHELASEICENYLSEVIYG